MHNDSFTKRWRAAQAALPAVVPLPVLPHAFPAGLVPLHAAGRGSFSEIWKVREQQTGRAFALKRLLPECSDDPDARRLLSNEAAAGLAVGGRHVVRVIRADYDCSPPFNLLEWVEGETLEQSLEGGRRLSVGMAVWIARQCAQGLGGLAGAGFSHGDVKPQNLVVAASGAVKLIDLGFAASLAQPQLPGEPRCTTGTPEYMAPETMLRGAANPLLRDMYSLGVVLYRMLSGRLPFEADTAEQVLRLHASARPACLKTLCPDAPAELIELVRQLLAKQPVRRPQTYTSLVRQLTALELATLHARFAA